MYRNLMIDIETLGTSMNAVILSIGGAWFDLKSGDVSPAFHYAISTRGQEGRVIEPATLEWWLKQDNTLFRDEMNGTMTLTKALVELSDNVKPTTVVWANGIAYDIGILENALKGCGLPNPWHFRNLSCMRTLKNMVSKTGNDIKVDFNVDEGVQHNALADAMAQAKWVVKFVERMNLKGMVS